MSSDKSHKKLFWHYVKSKQEDIFWISTLPSSVGAIDSEPSKKAKIFNEYFKVCFHS